MKTKNYILILLLLFLSNSLFSQVKKEEIISKHKNKQPSVIKLKETKVAFNTASTEAFLRQQFELNENTSFQKKNEDVDLDITVQKLQQYYKGIKVEFGEVVLAGKNNELQLASGNLLTIDDLNISPALTQETALSKALQHINAQEYAWESPNMESFLKQIKNDPTATYYPKSELVIVDKTLFDTLQSPVLAYKMDIYASKPESYNYYYIDATNGEVVFENPIIQHIEGPAATRYSGTRMIETEALTGVGFKLRDNTRGNGIETYNMNNTTNYATATEFIDNDNNWTAAEYNNADKDNAALDAHWGAAMTYDYFLQKHNRNSYDNNGAVIKNYVHYDINNGGAAWHPTLEVMSYGDGVYPRDAVVSLDALGHEIAHGVNKYTAGLMYRNESGAINESLSDIWGAMVEYFAAPEKNTYLIGEEFFLNGRQLRSMSNPNSIFSEVQQPDTYMGEYWYNVIPLNQSHLVHTNSGVMNYWFYLLAEGSDGEKTNDNYEEYNLTGIGKEDAAKIVYRAEKVYFTSTTGFYQARELTMQAAADLFGEVTTIKVANAWHAVGVGNFIPFGSHYITGPTQITPGTGGIYTLNPYVGATHYQWVIPSGCTNNYCWSIIQGQGTNTALIHGGSTGFHDIVCKIYSNSNLMAQQSIRVKVQNPYNGGGGGEDPCGGLEPYQGIIYPPVPCDGNGIAASDSYFTEFTIFDMAGRNILSLTNVEHVDLNFLSSGMYIIKARLNTNEVFTKKIIK